MNRYDHNNVLIDPKDYVETYQSQLLHNKWANIAIEISYGKKVSFEKKYELAQYLCNFEDSRIDLGRSTTTDHLKQEAVKWIKNNG